MNSTAEDIKDMLESESDLALIFQTNLFVAREPDPPKEAVTVFETPGAPPLVTLQKESGYYYPSVQIRVRSSDYQSGWNLINSIVELLHCKNHEVWNNSHYDSIVCTTPPFQLDWQGSCVRFVSNFSIIRRAV